MTTEAISKVVANDWTKIAAIVMSILAQGLGVTFYVNTTLTQLKTDGSYVSRDISEIRSELKDQRETRQALVLEVKLLGNRMVNTLETTAEMRARVERLEKDLMEKQRR